MFFAGVDATIHHPDGIVSAPEDVWLSVQSHNSRKKLAGKRSKK